MMVVEKGCFPFLLSVAGLGGKMGKARKRGSVGLELVVGGSCRVLNSLGKERGWWGGLVLGIRRRTGGTQHVICVHVFVCVDELAASV